MSGSIVDPRRRKRLVIGLAGGGVGAWLSALAWQSMSGYRSISGMEYPLG
jgi:hypothetical protein